MKRGAVALVGAGPGDPGLLTMAGRDRLAEADVIVYDRLVGEDLLAFARPGATLVYAGKAPAGHSRTQEEINALLVEHARAAQRVVRLKGGDPFVFGRGGEEALALAAAGIEFEVVPGVTSAVAAPAYAGVPVTHRGLASSFAVVTGHEDEDKEEASVDWSRLATAVDTLVVLMGGAALPGIAAALMAAGRAPSTPCVSIEWGTLPRQRSVSAPLSEIAAAVRSAGLGTPLLTIVGEVASLRDRIAWFEARPLFGRRVLVTRAREQAGELSRLLRDQGAVAVELPTLEVAPAPWSKEATQTMARLAAEGYSWCFFTSANAVEHFWRLLEASGRDSRAFAACRVAAIGRATAAALRGRGIVPDLVAGDATSEGLLAAVPALQVAGRDVLLPRAAEARDTLARGLMAMRARVHELVLYEARPPAHPVEEALRAAREGHVDAVTFASSSAVRNLAAMLGGDLGRLREAVVACIGPATAATAREGGLTVTVEPREQSIPALVEALSDYFAPAQA